MKNTIALQRNIGFALLFVAPILPTLLVKLPAMEDYLDHLGRLHILTTAGTHEANPYYQISSAVYPDLAMDLIVPLLGRFLDVEAYERISLLTSHLLIV